MKVETTIPWHERLRADFALALAHLQLPVTMHRLLRRIDRYAAWRTANRLGPAASADLAAALARQTRALARVSVIMPVYRPNRAHFAEALASLRDQLHSDWQLCLCDDGSVDPTLTAHLANLADSDPRIVVTAMSTNTGIAAATNAAATLATGDILLFMDQDDRLAPDCVAEFVLAFTEQPELDLAYSDSDKLSPSGKHHAPSFKPSWSPVLLLTYMYFSHAMAIRGTVFEDLGGLRSAFDGSQDYDLALRAAEVARKVAHIPRILYHWRISPGSTALSAAEKPTSIIAGQRAVAEAAARRGIAAEVVRPDWAERADLGLFALRFSEIVTTLSVIVTISDGEEPDEQRLEALLAGVPAQAEIILSLPGNAHAASALPKLSRRRLHTLHVKREQSLSERMSDAAAIAEGATLVFVSGNLVPDSSDWAAQLCGHANLSGVGFAGARILDVDAKVRHVGLVYPAPANLPEAAFAGESADHFGALYLARTSHEAAAMPTDCIAVRRTVLQEIGGLASGLDNHVEIGAALSRMVRTAGYHIVACGNVTLTSLANAPSFEGETILDPWYNRNLADTVAQFRVALRCPPLRRTTPVRLAVVTHNLDREGAQTVLFDLVAGLVADGGFEAFVISPRDGAMGDAFRALGISVEILTAPPRRATGKRLALYRRAMHHAFAARGAEAVLANTLECHAAIAAATEAGLGAIWWQHEGGAWHRYFKHLPAPARARAFAAFAQAYRVVQVAEATRRNWLPIATRDNFEVIRHAFPPEQIANDKMRWSRDDARSSLGLRDDEVCVLLLGSISRRKGQQDVLHAIRNAPPDIAKRLRVIIAGAFVEPAYHAGLEKLRAGLPPAWQNQILLPGAVDAAQFLTAADIFLCCSRQESAPRAIMEAMAFGLPVITTPVDGIPELIVEDRTGLFYNPGDHRTLLKLVLQLSASPQERVRLGQAGITLMPEISDYRSMIARFGSLVREAAWTGVPVTPSEN